MSRKIHVRPGKGQSKFGFAVGIIFCLIGLFVAIPMFGLFGILWTAFAGFITYVNYRNGFTNKQIDSHVIEIDQSQNAFKAFSNHSKLFYLLLYMLYLGFSGSSAGEESACSVGVK